VAGTRGNQSSAGGGITGVFPPRDYWKSILYKIIASTEPFLARHEAVIRDSQQGVNSRLVVPAYSGEPVCIQMMDSARVWASS
jgi:hypothetical protein